MAVNFKKGDIVQLKSGGPAMTVEDPKVYSGDVACVWFAGAKREHANFDPEALIPYEDPKKK
jgi:uncharacterized protein YodC (DUF2158 family)